MKKVLLSLLVFVLFCSHDMYLKLDTYFLNPTTEATIKLFNGTFNKSENAIDRDRMLDASLVGNGTKSAIETDWWSEKDGATLLNFKTGEAGTWVAGISTAPSKIEMNGDDFNDYLKHDGILDMLEWRRKNNALNNSAIEKYAKHVKAIFQVGDKKTDDWKTQLGYPVEFIPLNNPYDLHTGNEIKVKLLHQNKPLENQLVYVNYEAPEHGHSHNDNALEQDHSHDHANADHQHTTGTQLRTDTNGDISIKLTADGIWYLRTINLVHTKEDGFTHESNWATLTFEVTHGHSEKTHSHDAQVETIPSYVYWIGSAILLLGLFLWFNKKR